MTTYAEYQEQIKELQKKAEEKRKEELQGVIDAINDKIKVYGITAKDLVFSSSSNSENIMKPKESKSPLPPKYKNPVGEETWSGRGPKKPKWYTDWIDSGKDETELLINKP
jgi:DNA-binding protein H-NS